MGGGQPQLRRDKSARTAGPRLAACQWIAATGADRAVVTALENEGRGVLERAVVDANLEHAAVKAILKDEIVTETKGGVFERFDPDRRRIKSLVADSSGIINPCGVWR
jgi:hypothetical protein